jgi:hypothetical protein
MSAGKVRLRDVFKARKTIIDYMYEFGARYFECGHGSH